jgi:hypothetical protein
MDGVLLPEEMEILAIYGVVTNRRISSGEDHVIDVAFAVVGSCHRRVVRRRSRRGCPRRP